MNREQDRRSRERLRGCPGAPDLVEAYLGQPLQECSKDLGRPQNALRISELCGKSGPGRFSGCFLVVRARISAVSVPGSRCRPWIRTRRAGKSFRALRGALRRVRGVRRRVGCRSGRSCLVLGVFWPRSRRSGARSRTRPSRRPCACDLYYQSYSKDPNSQRIIEMCCNPAGFIYFCCGRVRSSGSPWPLLPGGYSVPGSRCRPRIRTRRAGKSFRALRGAPRHVR